MTTNKSTVQPTITRFGASMEHQATPESYVEARFDVRDGNWECTMRMFVQGNDLVVRDLEFKCVGELPAGGLRARDVSGFRFDSARQQAQLEAHENREFWLEVAQPFDIVPSGDAPRRVRERRARGGYERDDRYFATIAKAYVDADPSTRGVFNRMFVPHLSAGYRRAEVAVARRRGMLTPTSPGKAGGELTAKALALLASG